jgi:protoporphyrinogen oxidase
VREVHESERAATGAETIVVGAGVTGLTVALQLARAGRRVSLVERDDSVGGLARTFRRGGVFFDVGPHRFHTEDPVVERFVRASLGQGVLEIRRRSGVRAFGRTLDWPLRPAALAALPMRLMLKGVADLARRERIAGESFEAEMVSRYGRALYEVFFEPYTSRFLGLPGAAIHRDWARAGIDRAVIDRRVRAGGLGDLLRGLLLPRPVETTFLYPREGVGCFSDALAAEFARAGGTLLLGQRVTALVASGRRVAAVIVGGQRLPAAEVVWTGPLPEACRLLGVEGGGLSFIATLLFVVRLRRPSSMKHQWVYFGEEPAFVRVSNPLAFTPTAAPPGAGLLCVEVTCREGDARWQDPSSQIDAVLGGLRRAGLVASLDEVEEVLIERVRDTYPVYGLEYRDQRARALEGLRGFGNLLLAGRGGRYWYNNMDHSIAHGLAIAERLLEGGEASSVDVGELEYWNPAPRSPTR